MIGQLDQAVKCFRLYYITIIIFPRTEGKCNLQSQVLRSAPPPLSHHPPDEDVIEDLRNKTRPLDTALPPPSNGRVLLITPSPE